MRQQTYVDRFISEHDAKLLRITEVVSQPAKSKRDHVWLVRERDMLQAKGVQCEIVRLNETSRVSIDGFIYELWRDSEHLPRCERYAAHH